MKKIKNTIIKASIIGMTLITGIGAIASATANMSIYAAENESSEVVDYYELIMYQQAANTIDAAKEKGTLLSENDNVTRIQMSDGSIYTYTINVVGTEHHSMDYRVHFDSYGEAYDYAQQRGWYNIQVWKDYNEFYKLWPFLSPYYWYPEGDQTWLSLTVEKETPAPVTSFNMWTDDTDLKTGQETCLYITLDDGACFDAVEVHSSNEAVATVEKCGNQYVVVAKGFGTAVICAYATDGGGAQQQVQIDVDAPQQ